MGWLASWKQWLGRFLSITGWYPSVGKFNRLHVDTCRFSFIKLEYILLIPLKWLVIFLQSSTSTGYFINSTGSIVTNCWFSPIIAWKLEKWLGWNGMEDVKLPLTNFSECQNQARAGARPRNSGPGRKLLPARPRDFGKNWLLLHSWRSLTHKSHIECTSPSRSKIQYICPLPLRKWAMDWGFIVKGKSPLKHLINLKVKNITKSYLALRL